MEVVVLLLGNSKNDPETYDDSYMSNAVSFDFLQPKYKTRCEYLTMENYEEIIKSINPESLIINLCDGIDSEGYPGICVVKLLEKLNRAFTGCSSLNYEWKKSDIKKFDVSTPKYLSLVKPNIPTENDIAHMKYPLLVKPDYSAGSSGITDKSRVMTYTELCNQIPLTYVDYSDILIEEFIDGKEFTVLVSEGDNGPIVLEPMECLFANNETYKHYELKWDKWRDITYVKIDDEILSNRIMEFCHNLFVVMKIDGYVRFDLRMSNDGTLYVNDVNPYCALFYPPDIYGSADLILQNSKKMNHLEFTEHMFSCAIKRRKKHF